MKENLQFLVMVDTDKDRQWILQRILDRFLDAAKKKSNSCDLRGNWLEIWENEGANSELSKDAENGYLYYKWRIEVTPVAFSVGEDKQVQLAKELASYLKEAGCRVVVCANFEDKL